jgi:flavin prenyltransferase
MHRLFLLGVPGRRIHSEEMMKRFLIGLSGASGSIWALKLIEHLYNRGDAVHVIPSVNGLKVFHHEIGTDLRTVIDTISGGEKGKEGHRLLLHDPDDFFAAPASGSYHTDGMAVVPCSMGTLGALASGAVHNLLGRAADVTLKEGRPLVIVPRETPLSLIHLRNMVSLSEAGAKIVPPIPGFYHYPDTVEELVLQSVGRIAEQLGAGTELVKPWKG